MKEMKKMKEKKKPKKVGGMDKKDDMKKMVEKGFKNSLT